MAVYLISKYALPPNPSSLSIYAHQFHPQDKTNCCRLGDPLFAVSIGLSAAFLRIRREQREKFPERNAEIGMGEIVQVGGRRLQRWWAGDFAGL
ncbi:mitochondrial carrier protein [Aspergillus terreus]|uniref:Mitochondrial carrier protein n=1 Tax=Aspergillus terreus TaxID=33178 RepID=A0A5M3ZH61_ASPTE|nr:hypothetical protein ATETN484_0016020800 [Aspergillus terreus]GFF21637.1 mitochondrial carrier protein [Aspergillus terreus]